MLLRNGQKLGYAEYGAPNGRPVFFFHGFPGSRLEAAYVEDRLASLNARFLAINRPGMGLSDYQKNRSILDFPDIVFELARHLELDKFAVLGISGGGPYALACAYKIPSKLLLGCGVVSGTGNYAINKEGLNQNNQRLLFIAKHFSWIVRLLL